MKKILICMGSSCFARDNRENLQIIEEFLRNQGLSDSVRIEGSLCMGNCAQGPNITINGNEYHEVSSDILPEILKKELIEI
ncbi:MAG: (2Fe-2S) ferredoxin domain-containing protein [Candidatus Cloacimonetes bacterium]|nr:(2Fe-2S) ferredoxin domain-containing protein [Candidatus Cloacimonadota bacterium]NLK49770.1 (2Fe-2S) ferredoxin domain-containing protein [Candidatus Cloacimonadota bacterium]NLO11228.1 (2Fe-2S) ferredoxin domain-containing protein [Candidatus Cloacimonadota bacterium]